jgi:hypothetical protein
VRKAAFLWCRSSAFFGFCGLVAVAVIIWVAIEPPGWDVAIYHSAIQSLVGGRDPYADAMMIQKLFHSQLSLHPDAPPPFGFVYSPITLPFLRLIGFTPIWLSGGTYWLVYIAAIVTQIWVTLTAATTQERRYFLFLAPVAAFFPGFLASGIILSGNVAYILYASTLLTAVFGWRNGRWRWFYLAVLIASCVKAPFLSLVVIPVLSARRQFVPAAVTIGVGLGIFAIQPLVWPTLFHHYLQAIGMQVSFNRDFGCSPAGLFSGLLFDRGMPYSPGGLIFFLCYAVPLIIFLLYISKAFKLGRFSFQQWMPVMLVGIILLNPRLIEYDVAPLAIPLVLIGWRFLTLVTTRRRSVLTLSFFFVTANAFALSSWTVWKMIEGPMLVCFFLIGTWTLFQRDGTGTAEHDSILSRSEDEAEYAL